MGSGSVGEAVTIEKHIATSGHSQKRKQIWGML